MDTEESAISRPEPDIVVSDEPVIGTESTEEKAPAPPVDVEKEVL